MGEQSRRMQILAFCDALIAKRMVEYNKIFAGFLPCRIAVIEDENGDGWIITTNMDMMLHAVDLSPDLQKLAQKVRDTIYSIVDAGVNLLFTAFWYNHAVTPIRPLPGKPEETIIYGPLCMNIDVMRHSIMLPPFNVGDALVFSPVGAYNHTQWLQFIEYRPNVVMIAEDRKVTIVREAEDLTVVTAQERLPAHLAQAYPEGDPEDLFNAKQEENVN